ncbi:MAG TPA: hypothetical protein VGX70_01690, partial [Gemmataceae bacterium]|nr:hypothetical protein [Gemmataceae bacterium]
MLKPEAAKKQLEQWAYADGHDVSERFLPRIAQLPSQLRTIAYALLDRDAQGNEVSWKDREEIAKSRPSPYPELDELPAAKRLQLFERFFPKIAESVERCWQLLKTTPYQTGFARKSFRAPRHPEVSLLTRTERFKRLIQIVGRFREDVITIPWLAVWAPHLDQYGGDDQEAVGRLLASVIDAGGPLADEVFEILLQSGRNEHEIGGMGRHVTRGLLLSSRPEGWEFMEKMLLAAQRQEGLRQAILESVDEAHPQGFRRMLRLIMDHDLSRFSAVVRALNVWLGFQWDSASTKTVNDTIEKLLRFLDDDDARNLALDGKKAEDAFLALWSLAFEDAFISMPAAAKLLKHPKVEHRYVAALHLSHLDLAQTHRLRLPALDDADVRVAVAALQGVTWDEEFEPDVLSDADGLFEKLEGLYSRIPEKPTMLKPLVWPWTGGKIQRQHIGWHLTSALGNRPPTRLVPYLSKLSSGERQWMVKLLNKQKKWDDLTREALLDLAGDSSSEVRQAAINALDKGPLKPGEVEKLEGYLTRKTSDLRRGVIGLFVKQKDREPLASADRLLASKDGQQRLAGLEVLRQFAESGRDRSACQIRAEAYAQQRKQLAKEERTQLEAIANSGREILTLDNALGLFNPADRTPVILPKNRHVPFITDAAVACLKSLEKFVQEHEEIPITVETPEGVETMLLGTLTWVPRGGGGTLEKEKTMPLRELWEQWRDQRPKSQRDPDGLDLVRAWTWAGVS